MTRLINWLRWLSKRCQHCGRFGALTHYQNTAYVNDENNIVTLCPRCKELNDEYWRDMWADYHSGCL